MSSREGVLLVMPGEGKLLLVAFTNRDGEKPFARPVAAYQVPGDVLICSDNESTAAIAVGMATWLSF